MNGSSTSDTVGRLAVLAIEEAERDWHNFDWERLNATPLSVFILSRLRAVGVIAQEPGAPVETFDERYDRRRAARVAT